MKGNRTLKKCLALAMAVVFVVSGIVFTPKVSNAYSWTSITGDLDVGKWHLYASNGGWGSGHGDMNYSGTGTSDSDMSLQIVDPGGTPGSWELQAKYLNSITLDDSKYYTFDLEVTSTVAGTLFTQLEMPGGTTYIGSISLTAGTNHITTLGGQSIISQKSSVNVVFELSGMPADAIIDFNGFTFTETQIVTTTRGETEGNIAEGSSWTAYGISSFASPTYAGYTITNSSIGNEWWSQQTWIPIVFTVGKAYTCAFKFTTSSPKAFVVDNRTGDATIFTETAESIARGWTNNGDGTYTYFYEGTYTGVTSDSIDVRISPGYNSNHAANLVGDLDTSTSWEAGNLMTASLTDFIITPTSEYNPGDGYGDCVDDGYGKYSSNDWGYLVNEGLNIGFRTGAFDGYEYKMELKNRDETAKTAYIITDEKYTVEEGKQYNYSVTIRNNSSTAITPQLSGCYYGEVVLNWTSLGTAAANDTSVLNGTFTALADQSNGRFQIQLANMAAAAEIGVIDFSIREVSPWQLVSTYGSFTSMGDWEYYVDSHGEGYYDSNLNPNTYDNVGFKYVAKDSGSGSNNYRLRTSVLSDTTGRFNTGDYYDYSFTLAIDDDSEDSLPNAHIKVVEFTGDGVDDYLFLKDVPAVAVGEDVDITGTCGATVNGSRIGIVVDTEDDIALHITDFEVTRRGSEEGILKSSKIAIEGFQIRTNDALSSINYRTMCKAPNIGSKITVDGTEYTIDSLGTSYALDTNYDGNDAHNNLDSSYTILDPTPVSSSNPKYQGVKPYAGQNRTHGYIASSEAIIPDWKEGDTANTYYAFTMQGMDDIACYTIWVRPFVKTTTGELIYGNTTAFTSVAEIASHLYTNSLAKNISSHNYLYNSIVHNTSIVPTTNPYYQAEEVVYGWSNTLFIGYRLIPDEWNGEAGGNKEEMQYVTIEDWLIHANSAYGGAQGSYKGVNNDEICVRVDQPGNGIEDTWGNWLNWGIQIRLPNRAAYKRLENGKTYDMTIAYKTNKDGLMRVKCEANNDILLKYQDNDSHPNPGTYTKPGYHEDGIGQYPATAGYNYITERFVYYDGIVHGQNDASIVLMPCPSQGDVEGNGFPAGTIISNISVTFEEVSN